MLSGDKIMNQGHNDIRVRWKRQFPSNNLESRISRIRNNSKQGAEGDWVGTDYVVSMYPPPPRTIHPPHRIPRILEESVIVLRRLRIHYDNIVSLLHGIALESPTTSRVQSSPKIIKHPLRMLQPAFFGL